MKERKSSAYSECLVKERTILFLPQQQFVTCVEWDLRMTLTSRCKSVSSMEI